MSDRVESVRDTGVEMELDVDARGRESPRELDVLVHEEVQTPDVDERVRQPADVLRARGRGVYRDVLVRALVW